MLCLRRAIRSVTLKPGSWPPSPGFAPWAILISISLQLFRYSAVTPNLPLATCLIDELGLSPFSNFEYLAESSPPSPLSDLEPILFIAMASVSWASGLKAPREIPGDTKLFLISEMLWTWSNLRGFCDSLNWRRSLICIGFIL